MGGSIRVGTSGYVYPHWRRRFYPEGLPAREQLPFYARHFDTVELNGTFYRLPSQSTAEGWAARVPKGFIFAVKGSRFLTHIKRLKEPAQALERFFEAIEPLERHQGPVLWQLPPSMGKDLARLRDFAAALPKGIRYAVEFRNADWYQDDVFDALDDLRMALCLHDRLEAKTPFPPPGPFYYRRFHGPRGGYSGRYGRARLKAPASEMIRISGAGRPCYAYFNNDIDADAIADALDLKRLLSDAGIEAAAPSAP